MTKEVAVPSATPLKLPQRGCPLVRKCTHAGVCIYIYIYYYIYIYIYRLVFTAGSHVHSLTIACVALVCDATLFAFGMGFNRTEQPTLSVSGHPLFEDKTFEIVSCSEGHLNIDQHGGGHTGLSPIPGVSGSLIPL